MDTHGELVSGTEEADSFKEFIAVLFHKGLRPFDIRRVAGSRQKAYNDLEHLKKLRGKIAGDPPTLDPVFEPEFKKPKFKLNLQLDYAYVAYLLVIVSLVIVAARGL